MSKGEAKPQKSPAEKLRKKAESYLDRAVELGNVTLSKVHFDDYLGKIIGQTDVETESGAKITRLSNGDVVVTGQYESSGRGQPKRSVDTVADLLVSSFPLVSERNNHTHQSRMGYITLTQANANEAMRKLAKKIPVRPTSIEHSAPDLQIGYTQIPETLATILKHRSGNQGR